MVVTNTMVETTNKNLDLGMQVLILKYNNVNVGSIMPSYQQNIFGKTMLEWIKDACYNYECSVVDIDNDTNFLRDIKSSLSVRKYTAIIFCDTPLISNETLSDLLDYITYKDLDIIMTPRGYIAKTQYLRSIDRFPEMEITNCRSEDFLQVDSLESLAVVRNIIDSKIKEYHMSRGVNLIMPNTISIDGTCEIAGGVTIDRNVKITGKSIILSGTRIDNSTINDSQIGSNCVIEDSHINKSVINNNAVVQPFCMIDDSILSSGYDLESFSYLKDAEL